ncbi:MAG: ABC transporter ATP-binding protein [Thaumarchaeota archaeon]|nr:ABC transporter ATP-binding protein [Nitrososphaerota archaeon]
MNTILALKDLTLYYRTRRGAVKAVDGVSLDLKEGRCLSIVGESGCGKSSMAYAIMRILPRNVHTYRGEVIFEGKDLLSLPESELSKEVWLKKMAMVFQGAMNSLNPVLSVGEQVSEVFTLHAGMSKTEAQKKAAELLELVRLPATLIDKYPHELSGGMKQRVVIAIALSMKPKLLILDEPTSALDVITQANIINLLKKLQDEFNLTYIFITHDLGLASELSDYIAVMYAGKIVESGDARSVLTDPKHPYTQKLLAATPKLLEEAKLEFIPGSPPDLAYPPTGCRFHPRCPFVMDACRLNEPKPTKLSEDRYVSCLLWERV